tara:strand:+ start:2497 stop:2775 length:279 start_codon:yes stop_codon:yes gene_type:complete
MDDILKKAFRQEVQGIFEELESVVNKYASGNVVYTMAVGYVEDETEDARKWNLAYGWNTEDDVEFAEFMTLQVEAYNQEGEAEDWFSGLSLN